MVFLGVKRGPCPCIVHSDGPRALTAVGHDGSHQGATKVLYGCRTRPQISPCHSNMDGWDRVVTFL